MSLYEHVFLARQDLSSQQVDALTDQFKAVIEQAGGKVAKVESWGLKSLAYRIRKNRKAYFTLMNLDASAAAITEVERQERINEDILRWLTIKVETHEEGPSAMLQKRDRDDRDRDGGGRGGGRFGDRDRGPRRDFGDRPPRGDRPRREDGEGEITAETSGEGQE
jgi:small subunit ribosomal protein S6